MKFNRGIAHIALLLVFVGLAVGSKAAVDGSVSVTISTIILDEGRTSGLWTGDGRVETHGAATMFLVSSERSREITIPFGTLSAPFQYTGSPVLNFFHRPLSPDPEDPLPDISASVRLPPNATDVLLVFVTDDFDGQTFRVVPLDISASAAPNNSIRIINFTGFPVAWNLFGDSGTLKPTGMTLLRHGSKEGLYRLQFASFCRDSDEWRVRYNRRLRIIPDRRFEMILIPRPGGDGSFSVKVIRDFVEHRQRLSAEEDRELPIREATPESEVSIRGPRVDPVLPGSGEIGED